MVCTARNQTFDEYSRIWEGSHALNGCLQNARLMVLLNIEAKVYTVVYTRICAR